MINTELLSVLACPKCQGAVALSEDAKGLSCGTCRLIYPIREGSPVMLAEEAAPFGGGKKGEEVAPSRSKTAKVVFLVVEGKNKGERIEVEKGTCRALGRSLDEVERTRVFSVGSVISLDDASKKLVMHYVSKQFQKGKADSSSSKGMGEDLGGFVRGPDCQILDLAVSRLHAMIFYDESGVVGILDLVSKNGTFVNGAEIESKILKQGDLAAIGGTKIRYES